MTKNDAIARARIVLEENGCLDYEFYYLEFATKNWRAFAWPNRDRWRIHFLPLAIVYIDDSTGETYFTRDRTEGRP